MSKNKHSLFFCVFFKKYIHIIYFSRSLFIKPEIETIPQVPKGTISIKGLMKELPNSQLVDKCSHLSDVHI